MKKFLTTLAALTVIAMPGASFAAQGSRSAMVKNHSVTASRADASRIPAFDPQGTSSYPWGPGYNFPYPDRPYGDPDRD